MLFKTHIAFAFLIGLISISLFSPGNQILFMTFVLFGGLLPDVDHPKSKIGKTFPIVSMLFEHRGFFHSFLAIPVLVIILYFFNYQLFALPIAIGYASHLISDLITKEGIMPLHPFSRARLNGFITTGGLFELIFFVLTVVASGYFMIHL